MWMVKALAAEAEGAPRNAAPPQAASHKAASHKAGPHKAGSHRAGSHKAGPRSVASAICTPAEVVKCLDTLYRRRRIDLHHVRVLRLWGHRGRAPDAANPMEKADWRTWREALDRLDWPLRSLGIIS
jgi:hypothetical protein